MIDLKVLRENPEIMKKSQSARGENPDLVDEVIATDDLRRAALTEFEVLRAEQNTISKSVAASKGDEKSVLLEKAKTLSVAVKNAEAIKTLRKLKLKKLLWVYLILSIRSRQSEVKQISKLLKKLERRAILKRRI